VNVISGSREQLRRHPLAGCVHHIVKTPTGKVDVLLVMFDNDSCGKAVSRNHQYRVEYPDTVAVSRVESSFVVSHSLPYKRTQFPLRVTYATTIHKCQGKTMADIVRCNNKMFDVSI
jgi:hypothetical protein